MLKRITEAAIVTTDLLWTWEELKAYLRLSSDDDQAIVERYRIAAIRHVENVTGFILVPRVFSLYYSELATGRAFILPFAPINRSEDIVISYASYVSGVELTYTAFSGNFYLVGGAPARLMIDADATLPTFDHAGDERYRVTCTFGLASSTVPDGLAMAVAMMVDKLYSGCEQAACEQAIAALISPYKLPEICRAQVQQDTTRR